jgi:glycosyltransferase involved in cell wall biosynthesis
MPIAGDIREAGVSVVLGTYNRKSFLKLTIASIRTELENAPFPYEIIVVDGGSTDGTIRWLSKQKDIITIIQHNRGRWRGEEIRRRSWCYFMNLGFKVAQGKFVCMLSDDCLVIPGAILNGYDLFSKELKGGSKIGAVSFFFRDWPEKDVFQISNTINHRMLLNHGFFLKEALEDVGYIDEDSYFFYHADSDLCLKLWKKGYRVIESPDSYIEHYSHANVFVRRTNNKRMQEDWRSFYSHWKDYLSLESESNIDTWYLIEKEYDDPTGTIRKFRWQHLKNSWYYLVRRVYWSLVKD